MTAPSIRVNGGSPGVKAAVSASSAWSAALDSTAGVRSTTWEVVSTDETTAAVSYTLSQSGSVGQNVSSTSLGAGTALRLKATINGGVNLQTGLPDPDETTATVKIGVLTSAGLWVGCAGEEMEHDATFGSTEVINSGVRAASALSPGGLAIKIVKAATAAALPANTRSGNVLTANANGAFATVDGVTISVGDRFLAQTEGGGASHINNGVYTLTTAGSGGTPWTATRATDFDESGELIQGTRFTVQQGTTYGSKERIFVTASATINVTALEFQAFAYAPNDAQYLTLTANANLTTETALDAITTTVPFIAAATTPVGVYRNAASRNDTQNVLTLRRSTSDAGFAQASIGGQVTLELEDDGGNIEAAGFLTWVYTDAAAASEDTTISIGARTAGGAAATCADFSGAGSRLYRNDSSNSTVLDLLALRRTTSDAGFGAAGIGGQIVFENEDAAGNVDTSGYISCRLTTATDGAEVSEIGCWTKTGGGALAKNGYLSGAGIWTTTGAMRSDAGFDASSATSVPVGGTIATRVDLGRNGQTVRLVPITGSTQALQVDTNGDISGAGFAPAPANATYLVTTASAGLSAEVVTNALATTVNFHRDGGLGMLISRNDAANGTVLPALHVERVVTGLIGSAGIGTSIAYYTNDDDGNDVAAGEIGARLTDVTLGAHVGELVFSAPTGGAAPTEVGKWTAAGVLSAASGFDRLAAGALAIGAATATSVAITPATSIAGAVTVGSSIDRIAAGALTVGPSTATSVVICDKETIADTGARTLSLDATAVDTEQWGTAGVNHISRAADAETTANATPTNVWTHAMVDNSSIKLEVHVYCYIVGTAANRAYFGKRGMFNRDGGAPTEDLVEDIHADEVVGGWGTPPSIDIVAGSPGANDISVQVTGLALTNIRWVTQVEYRVITTSA
jgi:hypothetical protein